MLLKPINDESIISKLKLKYFTFQQCLVSSKDEFNNLLTFFVQILYFIPTISLFFRNQSFSIPLLNKFFSFLILSQFHTHFDVGQILTLVVMSILGILFIIITIYNYNVQKPNGFSSRLLVTMIKFIVYFTVPFMQLHITVLLNSYASSFYITFQVIAGICMVFCIIVTALYIKLKIKPLRKNNNSWNFSNQYEFNRFFLNITRTFVFIIDGFNIVSLLISAVLQYGIRFKITKYYQKEYLHQIQTCSNLIICAHISFMVYLYTNNSQLASKVLFSLLLIFIFKGIYGLFNQLNKPLQFPICSSSPYQFYDFFFRLQAKYEQKKPIEYESNQHFYYNTLKQHSRKCTDKQCPLQGVCLMKKNIVLQIENFVSQILKKHKNESPQLQILEEIWKLQRGKKFSFRQLYDRLNIQTEYIIFIVESSDLSRGSDYILNDFSNQSSSHVLNNLFLDQLLNILTNFSQLYAEIIKSKPKIEIITQLGEKVRTKVEQIQDFYMQLLKKKAISFKAIQLFIQFESYFLKTNSLNYDLLKKIVSIQKNLEIDQIQEIYLPAINVYAQTGLIENFNMECIKYLKFSRFQLKTKSINDIIFPFFKPDDYFNMSEQQIQNSLMFIRKHPDEYSCGNIKINIKFINNKKFYVYIFQKKKKVQGTNFILVDEDFEISKIVTQNQVLKDKKHPQVIAPINWREIYEKHIKSHQRQIKLTKLIKIDLKEYDCILMCSLCKTFSDDFNILSLKIMKNMKDTTTSTERRSIVMRSNNNLFSHPEIKRFEFFYDMNEENSLVLKGFNKDSNLIPRGVTQTSNGLDYMAHKMRSNLVNFTLIKNRNFGKGIKTYRLYGQDLYNMDLQDKDAYIAQFQSRRKSNSQQDRSMKKSVDIYIIALVISVSLLLAGMSIYLLYSLDTTMDQVNQDYVITNQIDRFKVNFYRILAMLRDVASGLYQAAHRDWIPDVITSYNIIVDNQNKKMFSNQQLTITYRGYNYTGNLNELLEVVLSDVFILTKMFQQEVIQEIHQTSIIQLSSMIQQKQDQVGSRIFSNLDEFRLLKNWLGIGIIVGIIIFYILMIYLCFNLISTVKHNLHDLMLVSDHQAKQCQQNAQKLIYAIDMTRKNFQIDFKNMLFSRKKFKRRKKQKETIIGYNLKLITFGIVLAFFAVNITIMMLFHIMIESNFDDFHVMKSQGEHIMGVYADLCMQTNTIDHTGIYDMDKINALREQLKIVESSITSLIFSDQTNQDIITYFFSDSCSKIKSNGYVPQGVGLTCERSTPNYQIEDPFTIGLNLYFTRIHYNVVQNISDTYAATGIDSTIFSRIFEELSKKISDDGSAKISSFTLRAGMYSVFLIIMNLFYCVVAMVLSLFVKKKNKSVQKLIKFLNLQPELQTKPKVKDKMVSQKNSQSSQYNKPKRLSLLQSGMQ